jgi:hypothetical protein
MREDMNALDGDSGRLRKGEESGGMLAGCKARLPPTFQPKSALGLII